MARIRTIKPEFWDDEKLSTIKRDARLLFIALWNFADDYGVVKGNPTWLKNKIFSYDDIRQADFNSWLEDLRKIRAIIPFEVNGERYLYIRTFRDHQKVDKPSETMRNPAPPSDILENNGDLFASENPPGGLPEGSPRPRRGLPVVREGKGREGKVIYGEVVELTPAEYQRAVEKFGKQTTDKAIEILNNGIQAKGYKYKSHYHALIGWPMREAQDPKNGSSPPPRAPREKPKPKFICTKCDQPAEELVEHRGQKLCPACFRDANPEIDPRVKELMGFAKEGGTA